MPSLQDLVARMPDPGVRRGALVSLIEIMDNPMVDAAKLVPLAERDPGLTAGLLKLCNSSLYDFQRRIGSPREALVLIGNLTFARLCFALSLEPVLRRDLPGYGQELDDLWKHSLITAYGAASLVIAMGRSDLRDRAFTAGLLHDIGKLVLDPELAKRRAGFAGRAGATEPGGPVTAALVAPAAVTLGCERQFTGHDHAEAGAALLEHWRLPSPIAAAVHWHHIPELAGEHAALAEAVHLAELTAHFVVGIRTAALSVEEWVADTFDSALLPLEPVRRLLGSMLARQGNLLSLAAGPPG